MAMKYPVIKTVGEAKTAYDKIYAAYKNIDNFPRQEIETMLLVLRDVIDRRGPNWPVS